MNSLTSIAQSGLNAALFRLDAAAGSVARASVRQDVQGAGTTEDLADDLVQQVVAAYAFKANLKVIQTQQDMLGSLLDVTA
ncbi:flagellar basal body rod protein [Piscinibacter sp. XHJ-5]|uniref:flagellar basal body rod C-terminal domain-containing protein n=1 Tax=Piscinibacter sp. XHJ-5 TaxID=3037797 RepID=UPI00245357F4|nr:flagellar basal body rod protein [Piscinibacter sp. XHJ-5]